MPRRNALMEFLQSASNAVASNVSGPVDMLGAGLRYVGVPVPQNALGSSQWMEQKGLTKPVPMGAARIAGETFGMAAPVAAAANAPRIAQNVLAAQAAAKQGAMAVGQRGADMAGDYMARSGMMPGMIAWHGSPTYKGDTPFDLSKVGQRASTEGWGAYYAGSKQNARRFGKNLHSVDIPDQAIESRFLSGDQKLSEQPEIVKNAIASLANSNKEAAIKAIRKISKPSSMDPEWLNSALRQSVTGSKGDIPASFDQSKFAEVAKKAGAHDLEVRHHLDYLLGLGANGMEFYNNLASTLGSQRSASHLLSSMGVHGIKHKAANDIFAVDPQALNYVIWDDDLLRSLYK